MMHIHSTRLFPVCWAVLSIMSVVPLSQCQPKLVDTVLIKSILTPDSDLLNVGSHSISTNVDYIGDTENSDNATKFIDVAVVETLFSKVDRLLNLLGKYNSSSNTTESNGSNLMHANNTATGGEDNENTKESSNDSILRSRRSLNGEENHQTSSYTSHELQPSATSSKSKSGSKYGESSHKSGHTAAKGHKSGGGSKDGKGFKDDEKSSYSVTGLSGHKSGGEKSYSGGKHKSKTHKSADSGKKGSSSHSHSKKSFKDKGGKQGGFKNNKEKSESGGKKNFHDKNDHKGYHSKYDHFDSYHESSLGGNNESKSYKSSKSHDIKHVEGHDVSGKHHEDKAQIDSKHGEKKAGKHHAAHKEAGGYKKEKHSKHR